MHDAILVPREEQEARPPQRADDEHDERHKQEGLQRNNPPTEPRAQVIGFRAMGHGTCFSK